MSAQATECYKPPWAVICWTDDEAVYVEVPMTPQPYILRFPLNEAGLSKALRVMKQLQPAPAVGSHKFTMPPRRSLPPPKSKRPGKPAQSPERKATILALLKKHGL